MGACGGKMTTEEKEALKKSKEVEAVAAEAYRKEQVKLVLPYINNSFFCLC
jgi:hypothetical protein